MKTRAENAAVVPAMAFKDDVGAAWIVDTTQLYQGVIMVRRDLHPMAYDRSF